MTKDQIHETQAELRAFIADQQGAKKALQDALRTVEADLMRAEQALGGLIILDDLGPLPRPQGEPAVIVGRAW